MERAHRLSRSRDFDTVYRRGRSVSTRYLVLHWFGRDAEESGEPRLGIAVPKKLTRRRNWSTLSSPSWTRRTEVCLHFTLNWTTGPKNYGVQTS